MASLRVAFSFVSKWALFLIQRRVFVSSLSEFPTTLWFLVFILGEALITSFKSGFWFFISGSGFHLFRGKLKMFILNIHVSCARALEPNSNLGDISESIHLTGISRFFSSEYPQWCIQNVA